MKANLRLPEAFKLYGVVLTFVFLFFLLGLFIGKEHFVEAKPHLESLIVNELPVQDVKPQLDFYSTLKGPVGGRVSSESPQADTGTEPEGQSEEDVSEAYTVQVGALTAEGDARQILLRLTAKGYPARMSAPSAEDRYYRVWVGRFETTEGALEMERKLRKDGFHTYLKKIS